MMAKTTSGTEITVTASFRLSLEDYQKAMAIAEQRGELLSATMRRLVHYGLEVERDAGSMTSAAEVGAQ